MPRTKISKKANSKRIRTSTNEERLENQLRELDEMADNFREELELKSQQRLSELVDMVNTCKKSTPNWLLKMKWSDVMKMAANGQAFTDPELSLTHSSLQHPISFHQVTIRKNGSSKSSSDDGYRSDVSKHPFDSDVEINVMAMAVPRTRGPLESAKRRRRSKSVDPPQAPVPARNYSGLSHLGGGHMSRSKARTPMILNQHLKSNSSDRAYNSITPKVMPNTPLMIMRHARAGESVFSLSGSPVVANNTTENVANVNIPLGNDILSIRPTEMENVDHSFVQRLPPVALAHLRQLKKNLDAIMRVAEAKWNHQ